MQKILLWHEHHYHLGAKRLWRLMNLTCKNPPSRASVEKAISTCLRCSANKTLLPRTTVGKIPVPDMPGVYISIDHFSPMGHVRDERGFTTALTIKDRFSKVVMCIPCYSHSHQEVVEHLRLYTQLNGTPKIIKMDNFFSDSKEMESFLLNFGITAHFAPAYHPQSNGDVEIVHRQFRKIIPLIMQRSKLKLTHWADACHIAANFVNFTPHTSHGEAPIFVHRGHISKSLFQMSKNNVNEKLYTKVKRALQKKRDS